MFPLQNYRIADQTARAAVSNRLPDGRPGKSNVEKIGLAERIGAWA
jgi:hypothetical protein